MLSAAGIGKRIKEVREFIKVSEETLAERANISREQLSRIENGRIKNPRIETIYSIAKALGLSMEQLLDDDDLLENLQDYFSDYPDLIAETRKITDCFYPKNSDVVGISRILQFLIYLPLIDMGDLFDLLLRIDGDIFKREDYLIKRINHLIETISKDNPAKPYADLRASQCTYKYMRQHYSETVDIEFDIEAMSQSYTAYRNILERKREVTMAFFNTFEKYFFERKKI